VAVQTAQRTALQKDNKADPWPIYRATGLDRVNAAGYRRQGVERGIHTSILNSFCKISINLEVFFPIAVYAAHTMVLSLLRFGLYPNWVLLNS
jgi:hypothetical protein